MAPRRALLLLCLTVLPVAGCSSTRLAYNNAGWLLVRELDRTLCLDRPRRNSLKEVVNGFLRWHRKSELPRYAALLRQLRSGLERPVTRELLRSTIDSLDQARQRAVRQLEGPLLRFGMSLGKSEAACLAVAVARGQSDRLSDERKSPEAYSAKELKKNLERLEPWLGPVSASQRELLARLLPSRDEAATASRTRLKKSLRLMSALGARDPAKKRAWLRAWFTDPYGLYTEEERRIVERQNRRNEERAWLLLRTLDAGQRERLGRRLGDFATDFEELARQ